MGTQGLPVMLWVFKLTIYGAPRTKKTHNVVAVKGRRRPVVLPSKQFREWARAAPLAPGHSELYIPSFPSEWDGWCRSQYLVTWPVSCRAVFYRDRNIGDTCGYYQALADVLEARRILANDRLIADWDGSRLTKDAAHPRVEITLTPVAPPLVSPEEEDK